MRGYFGIGIENCIYQSNLGSLFRHAKAFNADFIFTIGRRYETRTCTDTPNASIHVPLIHFETVEAFANGVSGKIVGIENFNVTGKLNDFNHPSNCIYVLGNEKRGISDHMSDICDYIVEIPSSDCLNVATAGSIVMYDRSVKGK